jgi:hypothetical protein
MEQDDESSLFHDPASSSDSDDQAATSPRKEVGNVSAKSIFKAAMNVGHKEQQKERSKSKVAERRRNESQNGSGNQKQAFMHACDVIWRDCYEDRDFPLAMGGFRTKPRKWKADDADKLFVYIEEYFPPILKEVACTVSCLPISQASVERLFSALKYVLSDNKNSYANEMLDAILFLRTNKLLDLKKLQELMTMNIK